MKSRHTNRRNTLLGIVAAGTCVFLLLVSACQQQQQPQNQSTEHNSNTTDTEISETFRQLDQAVVDSLNRKLLGQTISKSEDISMLYHPKQTETEGNYQYIVNNQKINDSTIELTLTETGLADDALKGIKTVFLIRTKGSQYTILEMKENYQCYRGHSNWSAEKCP
ncbi:MAG: hypothetical protein FGM61_09705 [Sediminibacterium sp.]|nr:hypothetical protein [Sediminibacterium sp.]